MKKELINDILPSPHPRRTTLSAPMQVDFRADIKKKTIVPKATQASQRTELYSLRSPKIDSTKNALPATVSAALLVAIGILPSLPWWLKFFMVIPVVTMATFFHLTSRFIFMSIGGLFLLLIPTTFRVNLLPTTLEASQYIFVLFIYASLYLFYENKYEHRTEADRNTTERSPLHNPIYQRVLVRKYRKSRLF